MIYKATTKKVNLPRKCSVEDWILARYWERFGTDEFIDLVNEGEADKYKEYWKREVTEKEGWVISHDEFKEWFYEVHKRRPKRFKLDFFIMTMINAAVVVWPKLKEDINNINNDKSSE